MPADDMVDQPNWSATLSVMSHFDPSVILTLMGDRDRNRHRWDVRTRNGAPHKPFLMLSLCDMYESGRLTESRIPIDKITFLTLGEHFSAYWNRLIRSRRGDIMMPIWALTTHGFWQFNSRTGISSSGDRPKGFDSLLKQYDIAQLDEHVFSHIISAANRAVFRQWIISEFFDDPTAKIIQGLVEYNYRSDAYGLRILKASREAQRAASAIEAYASEFQIDRPIRDQGFRIAVRSAYKFTCAACRIRVTTPDGITMVQGAHIRPHSDTADDRIVNGLALCHSCHWSFDEGLWTVTENGGIRASPVLKWGDNNPGYLIDLSSKDLMLPDEDHMLPDKDALAWHTENVFRQA